ncbi:MAG: hypothetical protein ACE5LD_04955 [Candidatus Bipolaricaulia bacterium]
MGDKIAEVIEASSGEFVAECYELDNAPPLGSLVRVGDDIEIYGVVHHIATESIDPGRRPIARGREESDVEEVYRKHPQLVRLLRTTFHALVLGHGRGGELRYYLPPHPARIQSFVYPCSQDELRQFTQSLDFLDVLVPASLGASGDDVLAAFLRQAAGAHDYEHAFLVKAGKALALLLGGEPSRLNAILRRLK